METKHNQELAEMKELLKQATSNNHGSRVKYKWETPDENTPPATKEKLQKNWNGTLKKDAVVD